MGRFVLWAYMISTVIAIFFSFDIGSATETVLRKKYYAKSCPNVETVVRTAVKKKLDKGQFPTIPATLRLLFHDCFVEGCDASVLIQSTPSNTAEKDHPDNLSLAGDGFDAVGKAKEALDKDPKCRNKVSCADILALAARDVVFLSGGPYYEVELGRLDGLRSTATSVTGKLPQPNFDLDQLISIFSSNGLSMNDLIALSAAHTVGFAHCKHVANRIYNFNSAQKIDPTLNPSYVIDLQAMCPQDVDPIIAINMDPDTHKRFDNNYYKLLQQGKGLFSSDQVLYTDPRSRNKVNLWARNHTDFYLAFVTSITRLGRIGIKTGSQGNIRQNCFAFN